MSSVNINSSNIPLGSHTLDIYATDRVGNISNIIHMNIIKPKVFNVKDYGARGDGNIDDTQAVRNAIEAAITFSSNNNNIPIAVYFPEGTYYLASSLSYSNIYNITFFGDGIDKTTILKDNHVNSTFLILSNSSNITFTNLSIYFKGPSRTQALSFRDNINNVTINKIRIHRNTANDTYYYQNTTVEPWDYITFRASTTTNTLTNVTITNSEFYDAPEDAIAFKVGGVYPQIAKGVIRIENNRFIRVSSSKWLTLDGKPRPGAAITWSNPTDPNIQMYIRNNYFESTAEYPHSIAIGYARFRNAIVENNTIIGFTQGIRMVTQLTTDYKSINITVNKNTIDGRDINGNVNLYQFSSGEAIDAWKNSGIVLYGDNLTITNNNVQYMGLWGLYVYKGSTNVTASNNILQNNNRQNISWVRDSNLG